MGADIHMFVEYRNKERAQQDKKEGRHSHWYSYGGHMNPGRNYTLFAILAGVRGEYEDSFEPKGKIPKDEMGYLSQSDAWLYIINDHGIDIWEDYVKLENAKIYESYGSQILHDEEGVPKWVEKPGYHSHSWMSPNELEEAFKRYAAHASAEWNEEINEAPLEYRAMLASMRELEDGGENEVRVIFWFDN